MERDVKLDEDELDVGVSVLRRREMAGTRDVLCSGSSWPSTSVTSSSSCSYCSVQSCSTWERDSGCRFSKLATSDSKQ